MHIVKIFVLTLLLLLTIEVHAAPFKPTIKQICAPDDMKPGTRGQIEWRRLIGQLLDSQGISDIQLDRRAQEVSYPDKRRAILDPFKFCSNAQNNCAIEPKEKRDTVKKLGQAFDALVTFIETYKGPADTKKDGFEILRKSNSGETVTATELLEDSPDIIAACVAAAKPGSPGVRPGPAVDRPTVTQRFMVRKKIDDLRYSQEQKAEFKKLDRATFSVTNDRLKHTSTYAIDGVAGY